jgi:hypothetical protein
MTDLSRKTEPKLESIKEIADYLEVNRTPLGKLHKRKKK